LKVAKIIPVGYVTKYVIYLFQYVALFKFSTNVQKVLIPFTKCRNYF